MLNYEDLIKNWEIVISERYGIAKNINAIVNETSIVIDENVN